MKRHIFLFLLCFYLTAATLFSQTQKFRSGIFLHHSTGECIWGPNGSSTSVPQEIAKYNSTNGLTGDDTVSLTEEWWPDSDNEWATWHKIFYNRDASNDIRPILEENKIVIIKSCFPSSNIGDVGTPSDTLNPDNKTIYNYKWHWRSIVKVMAKHPENFFVIWTNAPLVANATTDEEAVLSDQFCRWAKDTLAAGDDPVFGPFPSNVYVFDFFHKLADSSGKLPLEYASDAEDSHPNSAATELVAPQFVKEVFDAAIAYESTTWAPRSPKKRLSFQLAQNYPNPFNPGTVVSYSVKEFGQVSLRIYNMMGKLVRTLVNNEQPSGEYKIFWDGKDEEGNLVPGGIYLYRLQAGENSSITKRMILLR